MSKYKVLIIGGSGFLGSHVADVFSEKKHQVIIIDKSKFSYSQIEKLFFFPSGRWDLKFKDNILIKFPENLKNETLDSIYKFLENYNLNNISIIDARINNQIILNE